MGGLTYIPSGMQAQLDKRRLWPHVRRPAHVQLYITEKAFNASSQSRPAVCLLYSIPIFCFLVGQQSVDGMKKIRVR